MRLLPRNIDMRHEPEHEDQVQRAIARALIRDAQLPALRIFRIGPHRVSLEVTQARCAEHHTWGVSNFDDLQGLLREGARGEGATLPGSVPRPELPYRPKVDDACAPLASRRFGPAGISRR